MRWRRRAKVPFPPRNRSAGAAPCRKGDGSRSALHLRKANPGRPGAPGKDDNGSPTPFTLIGPLINAGGKRPLPPALSAGDAGIGQRVENGFPDKREVVATQRREGLVSPIWYPVVTFNACLLVPLSSGGLTRFSFISEKIFRFLNGGFSS